MLEEQIQKDYVAAMKAKDAFKAGVLSFLRAQIKNVIINEKKDALTDDEVVAVIKKQVKQRQDSIEQFKTGGRDDLVQKESSELEILKSYLPEEMSEEAIETIVNEAIAETGASSMKDMGADMKLVTPQTTGRADGRLVSELVRKQLAG